MHIFHAQGSDLNTLFDVPHLGFVVDAMSAGNSPATIWVDDVRTPRSAFIWDNTYSLYFGGDAANAQFNDALCQLLTDTVLPHARARQLGIFKLYTSNDAWAEHMVDLFPCFTLHKRPRTLLALDTTDQPPIAATPGFRVCRIERELLSAAYKNADSVLEEIQSCWNSLELFWERGFGFCALNDADEIVSWCTAEYVSDFTCGVGIETVEAFQQHGLATSVAHAFAQHCAALGWKAHWDSWASNVPSIKVAQKVGFRKLLDYTIHICVLES